MRTIRLLRSIPMEANGLAAAALALLLLKFLLLNGLPSLFHGAYELGLLAEAILGSVVASYAFFVVVVHFREETERSRVLPYVAKHVDRVVEHCQWQLNAVSAATGVKLELSNLSLTSVTSAFGTLRPHSEGPIIIGANAGTWLQYLDHCTTITRRTIGRLFVQLPYLDAELVRLLAAIDDSDHFVYFENMGGESPVGNADLESWAQAFYEYCEHCRLLANYSHAHLQRHVAP